MPTWRPGAIVFDACETLFDPSPLRARFEQAGLARSGLDLWLARIHRDAMAHATVGTFAAFEAMAESHLSEMFSDDPAGGSKYAAAILDAWRQLPPHSDSAPALELVREGRVRRATLTNEPSELVSGWLDGSGLRQCFEGVIDASAVMAYKPRAEPYTRAALELESAIERTVRTFG